VTCVSPRPRVHVVALGGTIAMTEEAGAGGGVTPTLTAEDLLGSLGAVPALEVTTSSPVTLPGAHLAVDDVLAAVAEAEGAVADGALGAVVVQGTDTLEETAFVADVVHVGEAPIVFTGAMRHPDALGADGPANLRDALVAAASAATRDLGVLLCLGGQVHAARHVAKTHAFDPAAFTSPGAGPLGWVVEGVATVHLRPPPLPRARLAAVRRRPHPAVPLHRVTLDDDVTALRAVLATDPAGLVVEGFGAGHVDPATAALLADAADRHPVVLTSRTGAGSVLAATYGFVGSERDLLARGLLSGGSLTGPKARLLLALGLREGLDRHALAARVAAWGSGGTV
jgi:L-asparaginase